MSVLQDILDKYGGVVVKPWHEKPNGKKGVMYQYVRFSDPNQAANAWDEMNEKLPDFYPVHLTTGHDVCLYQYPTN